MGKCPNCGNRGLLLRTMKCLRCGKECCGRCALFVLKFGISDKWACSTECRRKYEQQVLGYPLGDVGTDFDARFQTLENTLWYDACFAALNRDDSSFRKWKYLLKQGRDYAEKKMHTENSSSNGKCRSDLHDRFSARALQALASNMEAVGRPLDAARIYEKNLKMYDKARQLREKDKQVVVKRTDIQVNLNELLRQVKDGGVVAIYRCPHCGGKLKIDKNSNMDRLKVCEHCGSEIESMDLVDFLKTALS